MPMLPIPAFTALVLGWLAFRQSAHGHRTLAALLGLCAIQSALVALAVGYGVTSLRPLLPVTGALIPPLAWMTFRSALVAAPDRSQAVHLLAPAFVLFCQVFAAPTVDLVVSAIFLSYGLALLWKLRNAPDLPLARIGSGQIPVRIWQCIGALLIASSLSDVLIAMAFASGHGDWAGGIISLFASASLLAIGMIGSAPDAVGPGEQPTQAGPKVRPVAQDEEKEVCARLEAFLSREKLYLDPDLTLQRLSRRLHVPEKRLSAAVNKVTGKNVSRHINGWRIAHACALIESGQSITEAMLASGFNTKSNFNREFQRFTALTPSEWAKDKTAALNPDVTPRLGDASSLPD